MTIRKLYPQGRLKIRDTMYDHRARPGRTLHRPALHLSRRQHHHTPHHQHNHPAHSNTMTVSL